MPSLLFLNDTVGSIFLAATAPGTNIRPINKARKNWVSDANIIISATKSTDKTQ